MTRIDFKKISVTRQHGRYGFGHTGAIFVCFRRGTDTKEYLRSYATLILKRLQDHHESLQGVEIVRNRAGEKKGIFSFTMDLPVDVVRSVITDAEMRNRGSLMIVGVHPS